MIQNQGQGDARLSRQDISPALACPVSHCCTPSNPALNHIRPPPLVWRLLIPMQQTHTHYTTIPPHKLTFPSFYQEHLFILFLYRSFFVLLQGERKRFSCLIHISIEFPLSPSTCTPKLLSTYMQGSLLPAIPFISASSLTILHSPYLLCLPSLE